MFTGKDDIWNILKQQVTAPCIVSLKRVYWCFTNECWNISFSTTWGWNIFLLKKQFSVACSTEVNWHREPVFWKRCDASSLSAQLFSLLFYLLFNRSVRMLRLMYLKECLFLMLCKKAWIIFFVRNRFPFWLRGCWLGELVGCGCAISSSFYPQAADKLDSLHFVNFQLWTSNIIHTTKHYRYLNLDHKKSLISVCCGS